MATTENTQNEKIEDYVNNFVYNYLGEEVEFLSVVEDEDTADFTEDEQRQAHDEIHALLRRIRDEIFEDDK
jgi:hypothetical protein